MADDNVRTPATVIEYKQIIRQLLDAGVIEVGEKGQTQTTEKGMLWLHRMLKVPCPIDRLFQGSKKHSPTSPLGPALPCLGDDA